MCDAACIHMYLGHPTDNVQIESLKKYDAWKQIQWNETLQVLDTQSKAVFNYYLIVITQISAQVHVASYNIISVIHNIAGVMKHY